MYQRQLFGLEKERYNKKLKRYHSRNRISKIFGKRKFDKACQALLKDDCYGFFDIITSERELVWFIRKSNAWLIPVARADFGFFKELKMRDSLELYVNYNDCEAYCAACYIGSFDVMSLFEPLIGNYCDLTKRYESEKEMLKDMAKTKKKYAKRFGKMN